MNGGTGNRTSRSGDPVNRHLERRQWLLFGAVAGTAVVAFVFVARRRRGRRTCRAARHRGGDGLVRGGRGRLGEAVGKPPCADRSAAAGDRDTQPAARTEQRPVAGAAERGCGEREGRHRPTGRADREHERRVGGSARQRRSRHRRIIRSRRRASTPGSGRVPEAPDGAAVASPLAAPLIRTFELENPIGSSGAAELEPVAIRRPGTGTSRPEVTPKRW